jgi:hypothetical protein
MLRHDSETKKDKSKMRSLSIDGAIPTGKRKEENTRKKRLYNKAQIGEDNSEYKGQVRHDQAA